MMKRLVEFLFTVFAGLVLFNFCLFFWDLIRWRLDLMLWSGLGFIAAVSGVVMSAEKFNELSKDSMS